MRRAALTGALVAAFLVAAAVPAAAATLNVDTTLDDGSGGNCELRDAVAAANTNATVDMCVHDGSSPDMINIVPGGTITLDSGAFGELIVSSPMTINGAASPGATTISQSVVGRVLHVTAAGDLALHELTVSGGVLSADGPGILNEGALTLEDVTVSGNSAVGTDGAGIFGETGSTTTVRDSQIGPNNVAGAGGGDGDGLGGGIYLTGASLTLERSAVIDNDALENDADATTHGFGGGIYALDSSLTARDSAIGETGVGNVAAKQGGGIYQIGGSLLLERSVVRENQADGDQADGHGRGGIYLQDTASSHTIRDSVIADNAASIGQGGGLLGVLDSPASLTIDGTTFSGNSSQTYAAGATLFGTGQTSIVNSTFSDNGPSGGVGALWAGVNSPVDVAYTTIAANPGGGAAITTEGGAPFTFRASVLDNPVSDCFIPPPTSLGANLASDMSCSLSGPGDLEGVSAMLDPLMANTGPLAGPPPGEVIQTHALQPGSAALDRAGCEPGPPVDQRDLLRPSGAGGDSGAFELQVGANACAAPTSAAPTSAAPNNTFTFTVKGKKLLVSVLAPGTVEVENAASGVRAFVTRKRKRSRPGLRPAGARGGPGVIRVALKLNKAARKRLKQKRKVTVSGKITFRPDGGTANSRTAALRLKKSKKKR